MYYRRVNRGLAFTKPGVYAFGLVLMVGMIAVTTGINGLYVFLSAGLGGFIVSGLLSEKAMKSCQVTQVQAQLTDEGRPFTVSFTVQNISPWFSVFALQNLFLLREPRFRLIAGPRPSFAGVKLTRVPPKSELNYEALCENMPRGAYEKVLAMQLTTFPFGILEKFKLVEVPSSLVVAPRINPEFLDEVRALLRQKLGSAQDLEFYCHRAFVVGDSARAIDWKKSAARQSGDWVVKQFRSPASQGKVLIEASWREAVQQRTEAAFEAYLSRVRTTLKALEETNQPYQLELGEGLRVEGYEQSLRMLAEAPTFDARHEGLKASRSTADQSPIVARLKIRSSELSWSRVEEG